MAFLFTPVLSPGRSPFSSQRIICIFDIELLLAIQEALFFRPYQWSQRPRGLVGVSEETLGVVVLQLQGQMDGAWLPQSREQSLLRFRQGTGLVKPARRPVIDGGRHASQETATALLVESTQRPVAP